MTIFTSVDPGLYLGPEPQRDLLLVSKSLRGSGPKYISDMFGIRSVFHPQDISHWPAGFFHQSEQNTVKQRFVIMQHRAGLTSQMVLDKPRLWPVLLHLYWLKILSFSSAVNTFNFNCFCSGRILREQTRVRIFIPLVHIMLTCLWVNTTRWGHYMVGWGAEPFSHGEVFDQEDNLWFSSASGGEMWRKYQMKSLRGDKHTRLHLKLSCSFNFLFYWILNTLGHFLKSFIFSIVNLLPSL